MRNEVVKSTWYDKLIKKDNAIDTSGLNKTDYDKRITDIEGKIPSITSLATTAALNVVKNEIPNFSDLVKKAEYDSKISDIKKIFY